MVIVYLDDIIVISINFKEHLKDLQQVFNRLHEFKLRAKRKKCNFASPKVKFLGHLITSEGIRPNEDKVAAFKFTDTEKRKTLTHIFTNCFLVS